MITAKEIRQRYIDFFVKKHQHQQIPSAPLIPENDPSTLFTGSGMQPMVPYLLGEPHPLGTRFVDSQKCFRSQDIEEVGDNRHTTFFEMLGNWSLGDYFRKEQIEWMFTFLTEEIKLDPSRLYITVFQGSPDYGISRDEEAANYWKEVFARVNIEAEIVENSQTKGLQGGRIFYYPESKNWWSRAGVPANMPLGEPGGPDSEMFWDFGASRGFHEASMWKDLPCHVNCDCGRFMEIGNNVFMQYVKRETGFELLPKANIDFGGGLERFTAAAKNDPDVFLIDIFDEARNSLEKTSGKKYGEDSANTLAFRVILDHVRATTFLIADGVFPSNKDQGYYVRRLIRRAVRFARRLGITGNVLGDACKSFIDVYKDAYPQLEERSEQIITAIATEEMKFARTIEQGLRELRKILEGTGKFNADDAFNLYQSYGFPLELTTEELQRTHGYTVDEAAFRTAFHKHQELSRAGSGQKFAGGLADHGDETRKLHTATHLLHKALKIVLGESVQQKGSNITADRLRFDFNYDQKMTPEQIKKVEEIVNEQIQRKLPITVSVMSVAEAKKEGAIGLFEDKYSDQIKVYKMGDFSLEICGGPHADNTGDLGSFKISKEEASSAGVRRIKAVIGKAN
jgi:alanyl-tRNA synthetase